MVHRQRQLLRLTAAAGLAAALAGCVVSDESGATHAIAESIGGLPGVAEVDDDYDKSFTHGENFELRVDLEPSATVDQARQVARTFIAGARDVHFTDSAYVHLTIAAEKGTLTFSPLSRSADGTATPEERSDAEMKLLFDVMASPAVAQANIIRTFSPGITVQLRQPVDTVAAETLLRDTPALKTAGWVLSNSPAESQLSPSTYTSSGVVPDALTQQVWSDVTRIAYPDVVTGKYRPDEPPAVVATTFEVNRLPADAGDADRTAEQIAAALARLGRPVEVSMDNGYRYVEFTIGGCSEHGKMHTPSPIEKELARTYERC